MSTDKTLADVQPGGRVRLGGANITSSLRNMLSDIENLGASPMTVDTSLIRDAITTLSTQLSGGHGPVAAVAETYQILWLDSWLNSAPAASHFERHGIKKGTLLYASPPAPTQDLEQFRVAVEFFSAHSERYGSLADCQYADRLMALIDKKSNTDVGDKHEQ